jgi:hypothetical protein
MQENVIIEFSADVSKMQASIDLLEKIGQLSEDEAKAARKAAEAYKAQQDTIADANRESLSEIEKLAAAFNNLPVQIGNEAIKSTFKNIVTAMQDISPEAARMVAGLSDINDMTKFLARSSEIFKQKLADLAAEGKEATEEYIALEAAIKNIDDALKDVSSSPTPNLSPTGAVGDSVNIGDDEKLKSAESRLGEIREELLRMQDAGLGATEAYRQLLEEAAALTDQIGDLQSEIEHLSSDSRLLDMFLAFGEGAVSVYETVTSGMALLGGDTEELEAAFYKVQAALSVLNGVAATYNAINKTSVLITNIRAWQSSLMTAAINSETGATVRLTVMQKIFNFVASLNPYLLLVTGIGLLVGAIVWLIASEDKATKAQIKNNEITKLQIEQQERRREELKRYTDERERSIEQDLEILKAQNASSGQIMAKERELAAERVKNAAERVKQSDKEYGDLNRNIQKLESLNKVVEAMKEAEKSGKSTVTVAIDGEVKEIEVNEQTLEKFEGSLENIKVGVETQTKNKESLDDETHAQKLLLERQKQQRIELAKQAAQEEFNIRREARDTEIKLIENEADRRKKEIDENFARQKEDLEKRRQELKKDGKLTVQANEDINAIIVNLEKQKDNELVALNAELAKKRLDELRAFQDLELSLLPEGFAKRKQLTEVEYQRQIDDLKTRLETEKGLSDEQQKIINDTIITLVKKREKELGEIVREERIQAAQDAAQAEIDALDERNNQELVELAEMHAQGLIKEKDYNKRKEQIQHKYTADSINVSIAGVDAQLEIIEKGSDEEKALLKQKSDFLKQLATENANFEIAEAERSAEKQKEKKEKLNDALKELGSAAFDITNELSQMYFDNEKARLDQELADLDKFYTTDTEAAAKNKNLKLISEEELARKQAEIKNKQAAAEKQASYVKALIDAAKSITMVFASTPPPASFILAGITAAMTAVQIAKIANTPTPKYAKGRIGGRGEYAMVGERGAEIMYIPNGASIIPAHKSKKLLEGMKIAGEYKVPFPKIPSFSDIDVAGLTDAQYTYNIDYDKFGRAVAKNMPTIPDVKQLNVSMDENGFTKFLSSKTGRTVSLNTRS